MANPNSEAALGYGAKILMGDGATPTEVFAVIGELGDFDNSDTIGQIEVTNHQSPGRRKEYIGDLIDGDEISFECNYIPNHPTHNRATGLKGKLGAVVNFRIEGPGETEGAQFPALVTKVGNSFPVAGVMKFSVSIKKTGAPTYYPI